MISTPPRPEDPGGSGEPDAWEVVGSAGHGAIAGEEVDRAARTYWEAEADAYQAEHGAFLAGAGLRVVDSGPPVDGIDYAGTGVGFVWGPEGLAEDEAGLLGPVEELTGQRILEVGCGAAQCSAWLAQRGARAVGIDIAVNQLRHAPRRVTPRPVAPRTVAPRPVAPLTVAPRPPQSGAARTIEGLNGTRLWSGAADAEAAADSGSAGTSVGGRVARAGEGGGSLGVVAASAVALPFADASFDAAFASYGATQFVADLPRLLAEVRRVLRPGARWVFSVTHPIRWAFPDDPGPTGLSASGSYFDRAPYVERDGSGAAVYAEFHRTTGDYVAALRAARFTIEQLVEPEWPDWNASTWGGWSPLRGTRLPGTLILGCRAG